MKIKIIEANIEKVNAVIEKAEGNAFVRLQNARDVLKLARYVESALEEKGIPKSDRKGAKAWDHEHVNCNSYGRSSYTATEIVIERGSRDWFLIDVFRTDEWATRNGHDSITTLRLTPGQKERAVSRYVDKLEQL